MNNKELRIEVLLEEVVKKRASDLHLQVGLPPMLRMPPVSSPSIVPASADSWGCDLLANLGVTLLIDDRGGMLDRSEDADITGTPA